jgi:hypothetical protein
MRSRKRFSILVLISAVVVSLAVIGPPARAATVSFNQVSWDNGIGGYADQNSQWGEATVSFSPGDVVSLAPFGSGYAGFVNIVTSVGGGSNNNWAVQNMPVVFSDPSELSSDLPFTYNFDLGQADGTAVGSLNYSLTLSGTALGSEPGGPLSPTTVSVDTLIAGTTTGANNEGDLADAPPGDSEGAPAAVPGLQFGTTGEIKGGETNVPKVAEAVNGCAPGSAARSIGYLGNMFPSLNITQSAQQIYGSLTNLMKSDTGPNSSNGTTIANFVSGKNAYFASNNLAIAPTVVTTNFGAAIAALNATGDVEMGWYQGFSITNIPGRGVVTNDYGGHAVFVSSITPVYTTNMPSTLLGYIVTVIDTPRQGSGIASNRQYELAFDVNGNELTGNTNIQGASLNSFRIEMATVPEPSSLAMAAMGLGALAVSLGVGWRRRRRT